MRSSSRGKTIQPTNENNATFRIRLFHMPKFTVQTKSFCDNFFFPLVLQSFPQNLGEKEISLSFDLEVLDWFDHMKSFSLVFTLSNTQVYLFSLWSSWSNIVKIEERFSLRVYLLSADQSFFRKFFIFHELWKFCFVFHFACLLPAPTDFEKSWVFLKKCLSVH